MLLTYQYFSFESVHCEAMLKMRWVVKKWNFSFWSAINWSKCILMVSLYIWLSIYTNNEILCIIWKFDLSSRGVLGRIYALSIEVLDLVCIVVSKTNLYVFYYCKVALKQQKHLKGNFLSVYNYPMRSDLGCKFPGWPTADNFQNDMPRQTHRRELKTLLSCVCCTLTEIWYNAIIKMINKTRQSSS